jgi:threonine dehydrogenase-like Zn-dependent dehydrogenase
MKAAFKRGSQVALRDVDLRSPGVDEIRLRVTACGICGTDLHVREGDESETGFGHEIAGTILEFGPGVQGLEVGQRVVLESASACGRCANCRNCRQELCTDIRSFFHLGYMGFAEEMIAPAISAIPCEDLPPDVACLSEPLGVAIDMVRLADIRLDSNVLLMGAGPIGLMALAIVKRMGARRIFYSAYRKQEVRARLVERFGADELVDPTETPLEEQDFGCGIDRILVTSPPRTLESALKVAAKGGIISYIGIEYGEGAYCRFEANDFHFKKLQLRASFASPAMYTPLALQYLREGVVDGEALITHRFPLTEIEQAIETARDKRIAAKVVVMP